MSILGGILGRIAEPAIKIVDQFVTDKDKAAEMKLELQKAIMENGQVELAAQKDVLITEMQGTNAQRNWRPHLMYLFMFLIAFNGVVVPLVMAFTGVTLPVLEAYSAIPEKMWDIIMLCLGGYIGGRTLEKIVPTAVAALGTK